MVVHLDIFDDHIGAGGSRREEVGTCDKGRDNETDGCEEAKDVLGAVEG